MYSEGTLNLNQFNLKEFNKFVRFSNILIFLELFTAQSKPSDATDFENQTLMLVELTTAAYHMADKSITQIDYINDVPGTFIIWHDKSLFLIISKVIQLIKMLLHEKLISLLNSMFDMSYWRLGICIKRHRFKIEWKF